MDKRKVGKTLIWVFSLLSIVGIFLVKPLPQDLAYHNFVDSKEMFGIPNFWNVISNLPFLIVGGLGVLQFRGLQILKEMSIAYWMLFFGVALVAFGSGYYHWHPSNQSLVWDRLPMTIAFMSLFAIIVAEFIDEKKGSLLLFPLLVVGAASVFYWQWSDDLRFYVLVQFLPILLIPVILICYPAKFVKITGYWLLLMAYLAAKVLEYYDGQIFALSSELMSGHALKHVAAAIGMYLLLTNYKNRMRVYGTS